MYFISVLLRKAVWVVEYDYKILGFSICIEIYLFLRQGRERDLSLELGIQIDFNSVCMSN